MNGKTHRAIGTATGAAVAFLNSNQGDDELWTRIIEIAGGAVAGNLGARAPDWLEPAVHSWHRSTCHSITAGAAVVKAGVATSTRWTAACRQRAEHFAALRRNPQLDFLSTLLFLAAEMFWRAAAGFVAGFTGGYASHLALDAVTPRGIPLFTRGF